MENQSATPLATSRRAGRATGSIARLRSGTDLFRRPHHRAHHDRAGAMLCEIPFTPSYRRVLRVIGLGMLIVLLATKTLVMIAQDLADQGG